MTQLVNLPELIATIGIETAVVALVASMLRVPRMKIIVLSAIINLLSQPPFAFWLKSVLSEQDYKWSFYFTAGEAFVIAIETFIYAVALEKHKVSLLRCLMLSALANTLSLTVGLLLPL